MCVPFFLSYNAIVHLIDCSVVQSHFYMYWQTKKIHMICFIALSDLLWCSGTEPEISPRSTYMPKIMQSAVVNSGEKKQMKLRPLSSV